MNEQKRALIKTLEIEREAAVSRQAALEKQKMDLISSMRIDIGEVLAFIDSIGCFDEANHYPTDMFSNARDSGVRSTKCSLKGLLIDWATEDPEQKPEEPPKNKRKGKK